MIDKEFKRTANVIYFLENVDMKNAEKRFKESNSELNKANVLYEANPPNDKFTKRIQYVIDFEYHHILMVR